MTAGQTNPSKSLLMAVDQLPFPPRNGVTLPTYNYAAGLKANYKFKLVLLVDEAFGVEQGELRANERVFGPISVVLVRRRSKSCRITSELLGKDMFNQSWELVNKYSVPELTKYF